MTNPEHPHNLDAEACVLGAILTDPDIITQIRPVLSTNMFYSPKHRDIYGAMTSLSECGEPIDLTTISDELTKRGKLDQVGGRIYLVELAETVASSVNTGAHARIVAEKAQYRSIISLAMKASDSAFNQDSEPIDIISQLAGGISAVAVTGNVREPVSVGSVGPEVLDRLQKVQAGDKPAGLHLGFPQIDWKTGGIDEGAMVLIAGDPGMGKTSIALNICEFLCEAGHPVAFFSAESPKEQLTLRLQCSLARVDSLRARRGQLDDNEWSRLTNAMAKMQKWPLYIDDTPQIQMEVLATKAALLKQKYGIEAVFVDYIQKLTSSVRGKAFEKMEQIAKDFKTLVRELRIAGFALAQLSRDSKSRPDKRPRLTDLSWSSQFEKESDVVIGLYRHELFCMNQKEREQYEGTAEALVLKARDGQTGKVDLVYLKEFTRFENLADVAHQEDMPF